MNVFKLKTNYELKGDQPAAVGKLTQGVEAGEKHQVLLGVTGSGKTFTMANIIANVNRPTLVLSPNKTLAGQLYNEFKELFPDNAVEYFISYYDYYQPEAYIPATDTYIEKDSAINDRIDRLRHSATTALLGRQDVIVVASVSCIYGLGSPKVYRDMAVSLQTGQKFDRDAFLRKLIEIQYERNDFDFKRGTFRVRGNIVEIITPSSEARSIRISFFDEEIEEIHIMDPLLGKILQTPDTALIFPAKHYTTTRENLERALVQIEKDMEIQVKLYKKQNKLVEAQRLEQRTRYDMEMIRETGYCKGIENYSRYLDGRNPGEPPFVLLDFFPEDYLIFIDESHISIPQLKGMQAGDHTRKTTLVDFGFRLPAAIDNRPLSFTEFCRKINQIIYVSATPSLYEMEKSRHHVVEQIIRPTGLIDPIVEIRPTVHQVDDLLKEIEKVVLSGERVLVTTLTKRLAEKLTDYYSERGIQARYLHSDVETMERMKLISGLRKGEFSVLIGVNLLREGLDIPEVSLIGILEGDREGFLRSQTSLIQIFGRAARNVKGRVIVYADTETASIRKAIAETNRRREIQKKYNKKNGITPQTIIKSMQNILLSIYEQDYVTVEMPPEKPKESPGKKVPLTLPALEKEIKSLKSKMTSAAKKFHFEEAARFRDEMFRLQEKLSQLYGE
ncbi:MAG: excinuclease ABC subunit UvrB [Candidatus Aureabacteria bacterium]|nr:excinuclease ABC subunit UvrB [Candidatus Auribacterota bacterium]